MSQPFVGQVIAVGFNFAPVGWLACDGSIVSISEYTVLYQLIGTTYGGDGVSTFGLPDLRGRTPVSVGQGPGLSPYVLGQRAGTESVTLQANQVGSHNHLLMTSSKTATAATPATTLAIGQVPSTTLVKVFFPAPPTTTLSGTTIGPAGGNLPHENQQPFQTVNYIIAPFGIFPSQS